MTHEEIEAAIGRLRAVQPQYGAYEILKAFNVNAEKCFKDVLIELLEQADPDAHMELPRDADGAPIHVGDVLYEEGDEPFEVYAFKVCEMMPSKTNGWELFGGVDGEGFSAYNPATCRHYHKPTVEDVLREFGDEVRRCCDTEDTIAEYASRLREVMADDDAR